MKITAVILMFMAAAVEAMACSPKAGFEPPSLAENVKNAKSIFLGTVESQETEGYSGKNYKLVFKTEKIWKGTLPKKVHVSTEANTCNPFGQIAAKGSVCIVFLNEKSGLMAGLLSGDSSTCYPAEAALDKKQMIAEFEAKLSLIPRK
jgi:hypothetical protein